MCPRRIRTQIAPISEEQAEKNIQHHVGNARNHKIEKRTLRIADGIQNRGAEVIEHNRRNGAKIDHEIKTRGGDTLLGAGSKTEKGRGKRDRDGGQENPESEGEPKGGADRLLHIVLFSRSEITGKKNARTGGETDERHDAQTDDDGGRTDRGDSDLIRHVAEHHDVHGIEKRLQEGGKHDGNAVTDDRRKERSARHVDVSRFPELHDFSFAANEVPIV